MFLVTLLPKETFLTFLLGLLLGCNSLDSNSNATRIPQIMEALQDISHRITNLESSLTNEKDELLVDYQTVLSSRGEKCSWLLVYLKLNLSSEIEKLGSTLLDIVSDLGLQVTTHNKEEKATIHDPHCSMDSSYGNTTELSRIANLLHGDIALYKNTYSSPIYRSEYSPEYAVDDDKESFYHSDKVRNPWWLLDLGSQETINNIIIETRKDCCGERFHDVEIRVGNELRIDGDFSSYQLIYYYQGPYRNGDGALRCTLPEGTKGQFLSIQIVNHNEYLQIASVQVFKEKLFGLIH